MLESNSSAKDECVYVVEVFIIGGPMSDEFVENNRVVSRIIEISGKQSLHQLHYAIFNAFNREDVSHMYEFQIGGNGPYDPKARFYTQPEAIRIERSIDSKLIKKDATKTTMHQTGLQVDDVFGYLFDFGDE